MRFYNPFNAFRGHHGHHHFGRHFGGDHHGDRAGGFLDHIVARAARKLDLTSAQQELLSALLRQLQAQRETMKSAVRG